jgi:hypothetical protein
MRYAWSALMNNQFRDENPVFSAGQDILSYYDLTGNMWGNTFVLLIFFTVYSMLAYLGLSFVRHNRR